MDSVGVSSGRKHPALNLDLTEYRRLAACLSRSSRLATLAWRRA